MRNVWYIKSVFLNLFWLKTRLKYLKLSAAHMFTIPIRFRFRALLIGPSNSDIQTVLILNILESVNGKLEFCSKLDESEWVAVMRYVVCLQYCCTQIHKQVVKKKVFCFPTFKLYFFYSNYFFIFQYLIYLNSILIYKINQNVETFYFWIFN